jgi:glutamyl-tRNA synthetase
VGPVEPVIAEPAVIAAARECLPPEPFGPETWKAWTAEVKNRTGAKGRGLFMPLRLALTGLEHGPDLSGLLPLIGRERAARRLAGETA